MQSMGETVNLTSFSLLTAVISRSQILPLIESRENTIVFILLFEQMGTQKIYLLPWSTKPVISVNFSKLRFMHHLKAEAK